MRPCFHPPRFAIATGAVLALTTGLFPPAPAAAQSAVEPEDFVPQQVAVLGALDKITARERELTIPVGATDRFYGLVVMVRTCQRTTVSTTPQDAAFLEIDDQGSYGRATARSAPAAEDGTGTDGETLPLFSGWMFSASPSLSALEHPVYDIVLKGCRAKASQTAAAPLPHRKHGGSSVAAPLPTVKPPPSTQTAQGSEETG